MLLCWFQSILTNIIQHLPSLNHRTRCSKRHFKMSNQLRSGCKKEKRKLKYKVQIDPRNKQPPFSNTELILFSSRVLKMQNFMKLSLLCTWQLWICVWVFSCAQLFVTPWTVARQAPLSMEFSRQEYWSGLPFPFPGDLPDPGTEPTSVVSPELAGSFFTSWARRKAHNFEYRNIYQTTYIKGIVWLSHCFR